MTYVWESDLDIIPHFLFEMDADRILRRLFFEMSEWIEWSTEAYLDQRMMDTDILTINTDRKVAQGATGQGEGVQGGL